MLELLAALIVLPPLLAASAIGAGRVLRPNRGDEDEPGTTRIATAAAGLSLLAVLAIDLLALVRGAPGQIRLGTWIASGEVEANISFTLDPLALSLATLVALICLLTLRFSVNYMHRERGFQRFFAILSLFTGAMLLIVTAGNVLLTFVGWELAGVSSHCLLFRAQPGGGKRRPRLRHQSDRGRGVLSGHLFLPGLDRQPGVARHRRRRQRFGEPECRADPARLSAPRPRQIRGPSLFGLDRAGG
jgi:formate hydrogenlyase subunit 3/multisubunit Na+/H+ antiporter MnhD subunit